MEVQLKDNSIPCEICKKESKYRCPKCLVRTCSLSCCIRHKTESNCDGKRDRVAYIPLHKFSDSNLLSDYFFLEDALTKRERGKNILKDLGLDMDKGFRKRMRDEEVMDNPIPLHPLTKLKIEKDTKDCSLRINLDSESKTAGQYPKQKQKLVQKAKENGITLLLMPPGMERHKSNTSTKYDPKTNKLFWKVEYIFHILSDKDGTESKLILLVEKVSGEEILKTRLECLLETKLSHSACAETRLALRPFCDGTNRLKESALTLMKIIPCKSSKPLYRKVDLGQTLHSIIQGTTVIEYPTIEVILQGSMSRFPLVITELEPK